MWVPYQYREGRLNGAVADVRSSFCKKVETLELEH